MHTFKDAITFFCCLFGGGVLASVMLGAGTIIYFGVRFHDYRSLEAQAAFLKQANPTALVIGATVGAILFLRRKKRAQ